MQTAVDRSWNKHASQGQILALASATFSTNVFKSIEVVPPRQRDNVLKTVQVVLFSIGSGPDIYIA
jgi:hypothetical protein